MCVQEFKKFDAIVNLLLYLGKMHSRSTRLVFSTKNHPYPCLKKISN